MSKIIFKAIQRRFYDLLSSRHFWILFVTLFFAILVFFSLIFEEIVVNWRPNSSVHLLLRYRNNIGGKSYEQQLCQYLPIDAVYTWVNGSDPLLMEQLSLESDEWLRKYHLSSNYVREVCANKSDNFYLQMPLVFAEPKFPFLNATKLETNDESKGNLFYFKEAQNATNRFNYKHQQQHVFSTFIKVNCDTGLLAKDHDIQLKSVRSKSLIVMNALVTRREILALLSKSERGHITDVTNIGKLTLIVLNRIRADVHSKIVFRLKRKTPKIMTNISVLIENDYLLSKLKNGVQEAVSAKRFADNEELRFSLRSLEKFAPWIRNVFIVTNGQIPYWLNLQNPKVKVITHQQIFTNRRHLPTFNSAAIELNLHRIPGVSQKFIYFNDDIFLAKPIFPEDFYTRSSGYKVYLSWPVPNCEPNCPLNWIKDGFCDTSCNTSSCSWDGGDCLVNGSNVSVQSGSVSQLSLYSSHVDSCHVSCPDNWLADKFCDNVCNNEDCGFDLGDCGSSEYNKLNGAVYVEEESDYYFPIAKSIFLNLTNLVKRSDFILENAEYEKNEQIRALAINLKEKLLSVLLLNATRTNVSIAFTYKLYHNESVNKCINLMIGERRGRLIHRDADIQQINENSMRIPITFHIYPSAQQKPKILDDYQAVFNQSFAALEDSNQTLNQYSKETKQNMEVIERRRTEGYLTAKGVLYEKYKALYARGSLPWEQNDLFKQIAKLIENYEEYASRSPDRHLMDTFADSLRYVNKLYNEVFGVQIRKVPSHSAHLLDISVIERFQETFAEEVDKTCSHKLRSSQDMQFAFSYYYFLMSETKRANVSEIMHHFDTDSSGTLTSNEMKTLRLHLAEWSLSEAQFEQLLDDCSCPQKTPILITKMLSCEKLTEHISKHYAPVKMNSYQVVDDEDVAFKMVRSNASLFQQQLNELRRKPKKFICFNDDIDHNLSNESQLVKSLLVEFYESIVPKRSQFELPDGQRNAFSYVHEYIELQSSTKLFTLQSISFFFLFIFCCSFFTLKNCKMILNKLHWKQKRINRSAHYL